MPAQNSFTRLDSGPSSSPRASRVERAPRCAGGRSRRRSTTSCEPLAHDRVGEPTAGGARLDQALDRDLVQHLLLPDERRAALVGERRVGDAPALVLGTDEVLDRDLDVVEEHLVELALAGDLAQRADLDAGRASSGSRASRSPCAAARPDRCAPARSPQSAKRAYDDHTFWPVTT